MTLPLTQLGPITCADFMQRYWQREAVFLPGALPNFRSPLTPDEIAGLALEEDIESRLVIHTPKAPWQLENGPFSEERLTQLPTSDWSLLVNSVDHWIDELADLLDVFRFIPNWRLDDIMVSYAPTGASVGPHFDYYDVFLLQGAGQRHWQLGQTCDADTPLMSGTPLKILESFTPRAEYSASPGDILYIPPGVSHWGRALDDDCITYSIGFRAPAYGDILSDLGQEIASYMNQDQRLKDLLATPCDDPGLISADTIGHIRQLVTEQLTDDAIGQWFGTYMTRTRIESDNGAADPQSNEVMSGALSLEVSFRAMPGSRFSYLRKELNNATLFVDGEAHSCSLSLAKALCSYQTVTIATLDEADIERDSLLVQHLLNCDKLYALE